MFRILKTRWSQKMRTVPFPKKEPVLPDRFRGRPVIDLASCEEGCDRCARVCPVDAIRKGAGGRWEIDLGRCLFCNDCTQVCPREAIRHSKDYRMAVRRREDLFAESGAELRLAEALGREIKKILGRSFKLRQVSAGGCNACEADLNVLTTVVFDLGRFGIQWVASPRHADGLLVTGPVPQNMRLAVEKTYAAIPDPKIVIASGACAISGGPYLGHEETLSGAGSIIPVDLYIPGCPPHPVTVLDGMLRLLGRSPGLFSAK